MWSSQYYSLNLLTLRLVTDPYGLIVLFGTHSNCPVDVWFRTRLRPLISYQKLTNHQAILLLSSVCNVILLVLQDLLNFRARTALVECVKETDSHLESIKYQFCLGNLNHFDNRVVFSQIIDHRTVQQLAHTAGELFWQS